MVNDISSGQAWPTTLRFWPSILVEMQNDFFHLESGRSTNLFQQLDNPNIHNETQTYKAKKKKFHLKLESTYVMQWYLNTISDTILWYSLPKFKNNLFLITYRQVTINVTVRRHMHTPLWIYVTLYLAYRKLAIMFRCQTIF